MNNFKRMFLPLIFVITGYILSCSTGLNKEIQEKMDSLLISSNVPGINLSVIYKDGSLENYSAGLADRGAGIPLTKDHVLFSGSIGKTYAVALLMQLVDEGRVDLEKKLLYYFPDTGWLNQLPNIKDITVKMLLQHTSGLPRYINHRAVWDSLMSNPDKVWSYYDRLLFIFEDEPLHEAGLDWAYSDTGYLLVGMLIEKVTGENYYDEVVNKILNPQKLTRTYPAVRRDIPYLATGYSSLQAAFGMPEVMVKEGLYAFNPQMEWTGGGMASTTSDLARWAEIYYEGVLFSDSLLTAVTTAGPLGKDVGENEDYGMGSFIFHTKFGKAFGHTGFMPGYKSIFIYFPEREIAAALQINSDRSTGNLSMVNFIEEVLNPVMGE